MTLSGSNYSVADGVEVLTHLHEGKGNGNVTASGFVPHEAVRTALEKILASRTFARSESHCRFLRFVVEETIQGRGDKLRERLLGMQIFNKRDSFNPHTDPVVRVVASRLRGKLQRYYENEGASDPVVIEIPRGGYVPVFRDRQPVARRGRPMPHWMRFLAASLILGMLLLLGGGWRFPLSITNGLHQAIEAPLSGAPLSIAVLPFANLSRDKEIEYISDGLTEEIMNALTNVEGLRVVARTSTIPYKGAREDVRQIGSRLNASVVLEGAVQKAANRLRVTAHLVSAADGYRLWSQTYERPLQDLFGAQEGIARAIANTLRLKLSGDANQAAVNRQ